MESGDFENAFVTGGGLDDFAASWITPRPVMALIIIAVLVILLIVILVYHFFYSTTKSGFMPTHMMTLQKAGFYENLDMPSDAECSSLGAANQDARSWMQDNMGQSGDEETMASKKSDDQLSLAMHGH